MTALSSLLQDLKYEQHFYLFSLSITLKDLNSLCRSHKLLSRLLTCINLIFSKVVFISSHHRSGIFWLIHRLCLAFSSECITNFRHGEIKLDYSWKHTDVLSSVLAVLTCWLRGESRPVCAAADWSTLSLLSLDYTVFLTLCTSLPEGRSSVTASI